MAVGRKLKPVSSGPKPSTYAINCTATKKKPNATVNCTSNDKDPDRTDLSLKTDTSNKGLLVFDSQITKATRNIPPAIKQLRISAESQPLMGPSIIAKTIPPIASSDRREPKGSRFDFSGEDEFGRQIEQKRRIAAERMLMTRKTDSHE